MAYNIVKHRRGTTQEWLDLDLVPEDGELVIEECSDGTRKGKFGNGIAKFSELPYISDMSVAELDAKIADAIALFETEVDSDLLDLADKISEADRRLSDAVLKIETEDIAELTSDLAELAQDLEDLERSVINLVQPSIGILDAKYSEKLQELESQQTNNTELLTATIEESINDLSAAIDTKFDQQSDTNIAALNSLEETLSSDYIDKIEASEIRLQQALDTLEQQHAEEVRDLRASISAESLNTDNKIREAVSAAEGRLDEEIVKIRGNIRSINSTLALLTPQGSGSGSSGITGAAGSLNNNTLNTLVQQLSDLQISVDSLEYRDENFDRVHAQLTSDVQKLSLALQAAQNTQATNYDLLSSSLKTLETRLSKTDAAIQADLDADIARIEGRLDDLTEDDLTLFRNIYAVKESLVQADAQLKRLLEGLIDDEATARTTAIDAASVQLTDKITQAKEELIAKCTDLDARLTSLKGSFDSKVKTDKEAIDVLTVAVSGHKTETVKALAELNDKITSNLGLINSNASNIRTLTTNTQTDISIINGNLSTLNERIKSEANRIDRLVKMPQFEDEEPGTLESEVLDVRNGFDGNTYESAGSAVRAVGLALNEFKASLPDFIPANAVDGLIYENNQLYLTSNGMQVGDAVEITGGSGGGNATSVVKIQPNVPTSFTVAKGNRIDISFTYTSFEDGVPTGAGTYSIYINDGTVPVLSGSVEHGVAKPVEVTDFVGIGTTKVKVTCQDQYGTSRSIIFNISVVELRIDLDPSFNSLKVFRESISLPYIINGKIDKTVKILVDDNLFYRKDYLASVHNKGFTTEIQKSLLGHGIHNIKLFMEAYLDNGDYLPSNVIEFNVLCVEDSADSALLTSICDTTHVVQGDGISVSYVVYDPEKSGVSEDTTVQLMVYSEANGVRVPFYDAPKERTVVSGKVNIWDIKDYPAGDVTFEIVYPYSRAGEPREERTTQVVNVTAINLNLQTETNGLQLALSASGRTNTDNDREQWIFGNDITTTFSGFNWKSNGWIYDDTTGDTCLRLNGDARAVINFKPFATSAKESGKTIELDFLVRDVNNRDAVAINCLDSDSGIGLIATPDTAYLQSAGSKISCRYKENERIRVTITIEPDSTSTCFISTYLDGVLSGVQRYNKTNDNFSQINATPITLGSNYCGLDIYSLRIYNRALTAQQVLKNFIASAATTSERLMLIKDNYFGEPDEYGNIYDYEVSYEQAKALGNIPIITFTGTMPAFKGDKKEAEAGNGVYFKFEDPTNLNPTADDICYYADENDGKGLLLDSLDVQGTSSAGYARKNWKLKLPKKLRHISGAAKTKTYCIKVDYAEATGTHNTGTANYVETLYNKIAIKDANGEVIGYEGTGSIPPQKTNSLVRTTVQGFPCLIFEKADENATPVFSSKANFNFDKGSKEAFGFTSDYDSLYEPESWEFCNNTSGSCNFLTPIPDDWRDDFEPRYTSKTTEVVTGSGTSVENAWDRIEELYKIDETVGSSLSPAQEAELANLHKTTIKDFKEMHDWVVSTATKEPIYGEDEEGNIVVVGSADIDFSKFDNFEEPVTIAGQVFEKDSREYRLAKFAAEFENYFNLHYTSIYYVFTFFALMVDQRAKNLFLTRWKTPVKTKDADGNDIEIEKYLWYPYFYDNDTIFGINNVGALTFDYYHEDSGEAGRLGDMNVYNGQNSVLWNNFRECFATTIQETYQYLRNNNKIDYDKLIEQYITKGSDSWSAAIYNEDAEYKYISMARPHLNEEGKMVSDYTNLGQVRGPAEHHLRYFLDNRIKYCDSKWYAGYYPNTDNMFTLRLNPVEQLDYLESDNLTDEEKRDLNAASLNLTPYSDMYVGVRFKSGTLRQERVKAGETHQFVFSEFSNDTETYIYGANEIASIGSLAPYKCSFLKLNAGSKLVDLKIGHRASNYKNPNLASLELGTAHNLLKRIDVRNCSGLGVKEENGKKQLDLDLTGCPNIEHVYAEGTNLQTVTLPEGGYVRTLHLPATATAISIVGHRYLQDFSLESYENINQIKIDNCPTLNTKAIIENCIRNRDRWIIRTRLSGFTADHWYFDDATFIKGLFPVRTEDGVLIRGLVDIDDASKDANLVGTCYIEKLSGADYYEITQHYPNLNIEFGEMTSNVYFTYNDKDGIEHTHKVELENKNSEFKVCEEPTFEAGKEPAWPENDAFTYELIGWSVNKQISKGIEDNEEDYKAKEFVDARNGSSLRNIAGDRVLYPVFKALRKSYEVRFVNPSERGDILLQTQTVPYGKYAKYSGVEPLKQDVANPSLYKHTSWYPSPENITGNLTCYAQFAISDDKWYELGLDDIGYSLNATNTTLEITSCYNSYNNAVKIPAFYRLSSGDYKVVTVGGFSGNVKLELISLPTYLTKLSSSAFYNCSNLIEINLPDALREIGGIAFQGCVKLKEIYIPKNVSKIGERAFAGCVGLTNITVDDANTNFSVAYNCLVDNNNGILLQGLSSGVIPQDGSIKALGKYCFHKTAITSAWIPDGVSLVPSNAFSYCYSLSDVVLPNTIETLDDACFHCCTSLKQIALPEGLETIGTYIFNTCALEHVNFPESINTIDSKSFGNISTLKTVTFKKRVDASGNTIIPKIHHLAFEGSGSISNPIVFDLPWTKADHIAKFSGTYTPSGTTRVEPKSLVFGARGNCILNFSDEKGVLANEL